MQITNFIKQGGLANMEQETKEDYKIQLSNEINNRIERLKHKIKQYGSYNIIANVFVKNQYSSAQFYEGDSLEKSPVVPEYLSLISLKFPYAHGIGEFTQTGKVGMDFYEINELSKEIVQMHSLLHATQYDFFNEDGSFNDVHQMAISLSAEQLLVRNETFEEHHWERLEDLYEPYNDHFKTKLGFTVEEAIRICLTIDAYINESFLAGVSETRRHFDQMYSEILAHKHRGLPTKNFYPQEYFDRFQTMTDEEIEFEIKASTTTYMMVTMGHRLSFTSELISEMEGIDLEIVKAFLKTFCLDFEEVHPNFSMPEILHPLKDKPLLHHDGRFLCSSVPLLDYSLDRLFEKVLFSDSKKIEKYKQRRHDYLLETGMGYLTDTLETQDFYINLTYEGGELDGLIFCGNNALFIEAKSHHITDRAKKGYIDRLLNHVDEIVQESHFQAKRTYEYLKGKEKAEFRQKNGAKVYIDGSRFKNAYFISLTLDDIKAISCSLKAGNTLGLFDEHTFPWIISLYDLRVICEHMEGPAYLLQYIHRRKEFFKVQKYYVHDELDLLYHYLERNMRFDDILEKHRTDKHVIKLPSMSDFFNSYYAFEQGHIKKRVAKKKHYTIGPVKKVVNLLENSQLINSTDAAIQILELGSKTKMRLFKSIQLVKKKFKKDGQNHDFRMMGDDIFDGSTWMLSYWVGPDDPKFIDFFISTITAQFKREKPDQYFALLDIGRDRYDFKKIVHLTK
jgi:hypothetical protein